MKRMLCFVCMLSLGLCFATVYIVDNRPNTDPDFSSLVTAHTAAASGDTLYVCGSPTSYGNFTITKQLTLIGPGYLLNENPYTQVYSGTAKIDILYLNEGSANSLVSGMEIEKLNINSSNITIMRNLINSNESPPSFLIYISSGFSNINLLQNYLWFDRYNMQSSEGLLECVGNNHGILVANNIFLSYEIENIYIPVSCSATIENNVLLGGKVIINNTAFMNNIMISGSFLPGVGNQIWYNLCNLSQFGSDDGNQSNVSMSSVFTYTGSSDGRYTLLPTSPALGAGLNGVDCGAFGGAAPYVLSGMPANVPSIYELNAPSTGFILPMQIKAISH